MRGNFIALLCNMLKQLGDPVTSVEYEKALHNLHECIRVKFVVEGVVYWIAKDYSFDMIMGANEQVVHYEYDSILYQINEKVKEVYL